MIGLHSYLFEIIPYASVPVFEINLGLDRLVSSWNRLHFYSVLSRLLAYLIACAFSDLFVNYLGSAKSSAVKKKAIYCLVFVKTWSLFSWSRLQHCHTL